MKTKVVKFIPHHGEHAGEAVVFKKKVKTAAEIRKMVKDGKLPKALGDNAIAAIKRGTFTA